MKKIIPIVLSVSLCLSLTACSTSTNNSETPANDTVETTSNVVIESSENNASESIENNYDDIFYFIDSDEAINSLADAVMSGKPHINDAIIDLTNNIASNCGVNATPTLVVDDNTEIDYCFLEYNPDPINAEEMINGGSIVDRIYIYNVDLSSDNIDDAIINGYATSYMDPNYPGCCYVTIHSYDEEYANHIYMTLEEYLTSHFDNEAEEVAYDGLNRFSMMDGEDKIAYVELATPEYMEVAYYTLTFCVRSCE